MQLQEKSNIKRSVKDRRSPYDLRIINLGPQYPMPPPQTRTSGIPAYGSSIPTLFTKPEAKQVSP